VSIVWLYNCYGSHIGSMSLKVQLKAVAGQSTLVFHHSLQIFIYGEISPRLIVCKESEFLGS
jgi:hypothetical protein